MTSIAEIYELHRVTELLSRLYKGALHLIDRYWRENPCMLNLSWKYQCIVCLTADEKISHSSAPPPNHLFVISQILKDITRVSLSRSVGTGRREPWKQNCCYFPTTPPHLYCSPSNGHSYCLPSTSIPIVLPPPPFLLPSLLVCQR